MKIRRIEIRDYRGIEELATDVGPGGIVVKGANAKGKTTVLNAIRAALSAQGCEPTDIRNGAAESEILVRLDNLRVRKLITQRGPSLKVTDRDGKAIPAPQTKLTDLLGTAPLDPLDFFLAKKEVRRKMVLDAMAVEVTAADLQRWGVAPDLVEKLGSYGAGLEVLERYRKHYYDVRTQANRVAKEASAEAVRAREAAPAEPPEVIDLEAARAGEKLANDAVSQLNGRRESAAKMREAQTGVRQRVQALRTDADLAEQAATSGPPKEEIDELANKRDGLALQRDAIEQEIVALMARRDRLDTEIAQTTGPWLDLLQRAKTAADHVTRARTMRDQADDLERTLAVTDTLDASQEEIDRAAQALRDAASRTAAALERQGEIGAWQRSEQLRERAEQLGDDADRLDRIVKKLTDQAPRDLSGRPGAIRGLTMDGDTIKLDDVALESLSGAEQMRFAVGLARRMNEKAKILVVDGLERLDEENRIEFIKSATADGWQLLATRVADGELVIEAIEQ